MTVLTLDSMPGYDPQVIRSRPQNQQQDTIFGKSTGGFPTQPDILNRPQRQNFTEENFTPNEYNDTLIERRRMYVYRNANAIGAGLGAGNLNWTAAGPAKSLPTTRFNRNWRPLVGGAHSDMWGQHTNIATGQRQEGGQLAGKSRMRPAGINRLTVQRYRGQSFSQTTQLVGGR